MDQIVRLTDRHLLRTIAAFPSEFRNNPSKRGYLLCVAIVKHFFGGEWLTKYAAPNGKPGFLRQAYDYQDRPQSEAQVYRMVDLAELLFNLQHVGGFDDCISQMRSGQIEPTYAELDFVAKCLMDTMATLATTVP